MAVEGWIKKDPETFKHGALTSKIIGVFYDVTTNWATVFLSLCTPGRCYSR